MPALPYINSIKADEWQPSWLGSRAYPFQTLMIRTAADDDELSAFPNHRSPTITTPWLLLAALYCCRVCFVVACLACRSNFLIKVKLLVFVVVVYAFSLNAFVKFLH